MELSSIVFYIFKFCVRWDLSERFVDLLNNLKETSLWREDKFQLNLKKNENYLKVKENFFLASKKLEIDFTIGCWELCAS